MSKAIVIHEVGGPEVMRYEDCETPAPGAGQALVRHEAVGLNYIDVYFRTGYYKAPGLPFTPGMEGAGVVEAVGDGVRDLAVGDRVAYAGGGVGAYAEQRVIAADRLVKLPDTISAEQGAAMMLQGLTVQYLLRRCFPVKQGQTVLMHAAAGGVGLILCQWAKYLGVNVIGTVSSDEKAELARAHGCTHTVVYTREDFVQRTREITGGEGVPVVYDGVGKDTFARSLDCLRPLGMLVSFGAASGSVPPLDVNLLSAKGSLYLTRPTLMTYTAARTDLVTMAKELFDVVGSGVVKLEVNQRFPLAVAAEAHRALEARKTTGSTILTI